MCLFSIKFQLFMLYSIVSYTYIQSKFIILSFINAVLKNLLFGWLVGRHLFLREFLWDNIYDVYVSTTAAMVMLFRDIGPYRK